MPRDYGPVPISRLKSQAAKMSDALKQGRRVLISRQGQVVAQIEPPSATRHQEAIALFAINADRAPRAISPSTLSQGAGSEAVHAVEQGETQLLTRRSKVVGVLTSFVPNDDWGTILERERALSAFEAAYPDATPEQFEETFDRRGESTTTAEDAETETQPASSKWLAGLASVGVAAAFTGTGPVGVGASVLAMGTVEALKAYRHAQFARATALKSLGKPEAAEEAYRTVLRSLEESPASTEEAFRGVLQRLEDQPAPPEAVLEVGSYLALADIYNNADRSKEALESAEHALARLRSIPVSAGA